MSEERRSSYVSTEGNNDLALTKSVQQHERALKKEDHSHEEQITAMNNRNEQETLLKELGWIGRIFGGERNSSKNITAFINVCLILGASIISVIVYFDKKDIPFVESLWTSILPIVTLSLGYLFGKK